MKRFFTLCLLAVCINTHAQYISTCQTPSNDCPTVCPGGILTVEVFQIQDLNNGDTVQMILSNASGSFASGTTTLNFTAYSTSEGTSWTNGPYIWSDGNGTVTNLYVEVTIPVNQPQGTAYTCYIYAPSNSGNSPQLFRCSEPTGVIQVIPAWPTVAQIPANTWGINQWIASMYTYTPTVPNGDSLTAADIAQIDFFNPANYQGEFYKDSLSFDIDWLTGEGGFAPGAPGVLNDSTSVPCSQGFIDDFSLIMLRKENFTPGMYQLSIQSDDGMRLSIDSGQTWLLSSWYQQKYTESYQSTSTQYPNGICLSGNTDLYIEYFQHLVDSHMTFRATLLSAINVTNPTSQSTCAGGTVSFTAATTNATPTYVWYYSTNGGTTYNPVPNSAPFSGVATGTFTVTNVPANYNGYLFQCDIGGFCSNPYVTPAVTLTVGSLPAIITQPSDTSACSGQNVSFSVTDQNAVSYQWQVNTGSGWTNLTNGGVYSEVDSPALDITGVTAGMNNYQYQCILTGGCGGATDTTNVATLTIGAVTAISGQPQNSSICSGQNTSFNVNAANAASYQWQVNTGSGFTNLSDGGVYSGVNNATLAITAAASSMNGYQYQCILTGCGGGTITSNSATLNIGAMDSIIVQPQSSSICPGQNTTFVVAGAGIQSYQWQVNLGTGFANLTNGGFYSGADSSVLTVSGVSSLMNGYQFQCVLTGCGGGTITSNAVTLNVGQADSILAQPQNTTICPQQDGFFTIAAVGAGSYQWQVNTGSGWTNLSTSGPYINVDSPSLGIKGTNTATSGYKYQCIVTGCGGGTLTSDSAILTVSDTPSITQQPVSVNLCPPQNLNFSITGSAASYQWQMADSSSNFVNLVNNGTYSNVNTNTLNITNADSTLDQKQYRCLAIACGDTMPSTVAEILSCDEGDIYFPNAFNPKSSHLDDEVFEAFGAKDLVTSFSLKIFDRWGELVFQTTDINFTWDGTYRLQKLLPGPVVYMVHYNLNGSSKTLVKKGALAIME